MKITRRDALATGAGAALATMAGAERTAGQEAKSMGVPENVYRGELVAFPGPWAFQLGKSVIILVSDPELLALADPDRVLNLATGFEKHEASLRQVCERAKAQGHRTLIVAFDHFFSQYRPGQAGPRKLTPDMDAYIGRIAAIGKFAEGYGLGLELSLLSPLEIGPAYEKETGESGLWLHYRKGLRDTATGAYSVSLWQQKRWANNKGFVDLADAGIRAFAFTEAPVRGTRYRVVDPRSIVEVTEGARVQKITRTAAGDVRAKIRIYGSGHTDLKAQNRVLVIQQYRTPEMDYFSEKALPYLTGLVDKYAAAGVKLNGLYSDEMHIQQDWNYFGHHDNGELALRYASPGLARRFAAAHGAQYADLAKYMVYFCYGQEDDVAFDLSAKAGVSCVFGASPEAIQETALLRARYYRMLQDGVVDLFTAAKRHCEQRMGHRLEARAHATWAESPTVDSWYSGQENMFKHAYEYTSNFQWSNTVHQSAAACSDYFKWGDFLTGNGNDTCEIGWLDRNYVGLALACSTGILNEVPYSYAAHWGMPAELARRREALVDTYGAAGSPLFGLVQEMQHRDTGVLMLYPLDLVAVEERFGSWTTQYGYANSVTAQKLIERGVVKSGAIEMAGRRFTTLVALFEPFPSPKLLALMRELAEAGGRVVWSGPPPLIAEDGNPVLSDWRALFGAEYAPAADGGLLAPGCRVEFGGALQGIAPQTILTDFLVDRIHPVTPRAGAEPVATVKGRTVGTIRHTARRGSLTFLGFRPRDDQSRSLGYEARWWFDILARLDAYPATRAFPTYNDNPDSLSRTTPYLACRFPNGAIAICPHFRETEEDWPGGFARDAKADAAYLARVPPPSEELKLAGFRVSGHTVSYAGKRAVAFRTDRSGGLVAFAGSDCHKITVDGKTTVFADNDIPQLAFAPVQESRRVPGGAALQIMVYGTGTLRLPAAHLSAGVRLFAEGSAPGSRGDAVACRIQDGSLVFTVDAAHQGRWLYAVA
jgi:hypothetical protein